MDAPSNSDVVYFVSVPGSYIPGQDIQARYLLNDSCETHPRDWIGLFRVGWTSKRDYYTFEWAPPADKEECQRTVKFVGSRLPHEDGNFYQFCYVSRDGEVRGSSRPFQFSKSAGRSNSDDLEMVEVEDDENLVLLRTRTDAQVTELEKKIAELTQKNENVEGSFVQVQSEVQDIKADRDRASADLAACNEQLQQKNDHISELESAMDLKEKEIIELKAAHAAKDEKMKEHQDIYDQVEQALQGTTAENTQLQQMLANSEKTKDEQIAALTLANTTLAAKKEESETELRMHCTTLEEQLRKLEEEKEVMISRNEYYVADNERLDQCVHDQKAQLSALEQEMQDLKAQFAALEQENIAQAEQLDEAKKTAKEFQEMVTSKEQELFITQQNLCEVIGNIKEPRDILPKLTTEDKVDKSVYDALQRAYEDVEIRWKKDERVIAQQKGKIVELEERVRRCEQEYIAVVTENTGLKKMQQLTEDGLDTTHLKAQVHQLEEELRIFQEKHDQKIADKNEQLQKQQDILDTKFNEIAGLEEQQKAMQTLIDTLNAENSQLKQQIHQIREENTRLSRPAPAPQPSARSPRPSDHYQPVGAPRPRPHHHHQQQPSSNDSHVCPVCGVRFPRTVNQVDIERHVNGHFDH